MALEQLRAFSRGIPQESLGSSRIVGLDNFALLDSSELKEEHELLNLLIDELKTETDTTTIEKINNSNIFVQAVNFAANLIGVKSESLPRKEIEDKIFKSSQEQRTKYYLAFIERISWYELRLFSCATDRFQGDYFFRDGWPTKYLLKLIEVGIDMNATAKPTFEWISIHRYFYYIGNHTEEFFDAFYHCLLKSPVLEEMKSVFITIRSTLYDSSHSIPSIEVMIQKIDALLGEGVWQEIFPVEVWAESATKEYNELPQSARIPWLKLFKLCRKNSSSKPTKKWLNEGKSIIDEIGSEEFRKRILNWFLLFEQGSSSSFLAMNEYVGGSRLIVNETNARVLRGFVFLSIFIPDDEVVKAIGKLAQSAYRKIPNVGARSMKLGNAAIYSLSQIATGEAVTQLAILDSKMKGMSILKGIEKAQSAVADKAGVSTAELEEVSVPHFDLVNGKLSYKLGECSVDISIEGAKAKIQFKNENGKEIKTASVAMKQKFASELRSFKSQSKDIEVILSAQVSRIEQVFLGNRDWDYLLWRERYLDHGLVGTISRRLIWNFQRGEKQSSAMFYAGEMVSVEGKKLDWLDGDTRVSLFHPIFEIPSVVQSWREWLMEKQICQPFKQAHREIYLVTDAERTTEVYSNRFAAHIIKQNQFKALTEARKWRSQYRLQGVDQGSEPTQKYLTAYGIRTEFWVEGVSEESNNIGAYEYLATDQVRFYNNTQEVIAITDVPDIVFSEMMRDVDLFVGVTSIGNDPGWMDGGADNTRFNQYWIDYSYGELNDSAKFRKAALEMIIPKMKIANKCTFTDKYLVVKGAMRTYKIHIGSSNILMEPGDQYLCIVPKQSIQKLSEKVFLPFEGDSRLSVILSKAIMLAEDLKISDETIIRQIKRI